MLLQNKNIRLLCVVIIFLQIILLFAFNTTNVYADDTCRICASGKHKTSTKETTYHCCKLCKKSHDVTDMSGFVRFAYEQNIMVKSGQAVDDNVEEILRFDMQSSTYSTLWARARGYYDGLAPIGMILSVIYVLVALLDGAGKESLNPEQIFKALAKIFLSVLIISIGFDIIQVAIDFTVGLFDVISEEAPDSLGGLGSSKDCLYERLAGVGVLDVVFSLVSIIKNLMKYIILLVVSTTCNMVIWARLLDLIIRTIMAPIGIADLAETGTQGNGWHYLKKIMAAAISGAVCLGCIFCHRLLSKTATASFGAMGSGIIGIVLAISLLSTLFQTKDIADDIIGV